MSSRDHAQALMAQTPSTTAATKFFWDTNQDYSPRTRWVHAVGRVRFQSASRVDTPFDLADVAHALETEGVIVKQLTPRYEAEQEDSSWDLGAAISSFFSDLGENSCCISPRSRSDEYIRERQRSIIRKYTTSSFYDG